MAGVGTGAAERALPALGTVPGQPREAGERGHWLDVRGQLCASSPGRCPLSPPASAPPSASPLPSSRGADGHICRLTGTAGDALLVSCCSFIFAWIFFLTAT